MKLVVLGKNSELLLSALLIGLALFLFREVWVSVQHLHSIYKHLLEGAVFTEGPPIRGAQQYFLVSLCSAAWFLLVFAFLFSRRFYPLWIAEFTFILMPFWVVLFGLYKERADYEFIPLGNYLVHRVLFSWNFLWVALSIVIAIFGVKHCRLMRKEAT